MDRTMRILTRKGLLAGDTKDDYKVRLCLPGAKQGDGGGELLSVMLGAITERLCVGIEGTCYNDDFRLLCFQHQREGYHKSTLKLGRLRLHVPPNK